MGKNGMAAYPTCRKILAWFKNRPVLKIANSGLKHEEIWHHTITPVESAGAHGRSYDSQAGGPRTAFEACLLRVTVVFGHVISQNCSKNTVIIEFRYQTDLPFYFRYRAAIGEQATGSPLVDKSFVMVYIGLWVHNWCLRPFFGIGHLIWFFTSANLPLFGKVL